MVGSEGEARRTPDVQSGGEASQGSLPPLRSTHPLSYRTPSTQQALRGRSVTPLASIVASMHDSSRRTEQGARQGDAQDHAAASAAASTAALPVSTAGEYATAQAFPNSVSVPSASGSISKDAGSQLVAGSTEKRSALDVLMSLEERPCSAFFEAQKVGYWYEPKVSCFDLAGWPNSCAWQACEKCTRCEAMLEVRNGE